MLQALHRRLPFSHVVICGNTEPADTRGMTPLAWKHLLASLWYFQQ
jgi:hypothetical protein